MMGHKEKLKSGDEYDLTSKWRKRKWLPYHSGKWKTIKQRLSRRNRRDIKNQMRLQIIFWKQYGEEHDLHNS